MGNDGLPALQFKSDPINSCKENCGNHDKINYSQPINKEYAQLKLCNRSRIPLSNIFCSYQFI